MTEVDELKIKLDNLKKVAKIVLEESKKCALSFNGKEMKELAKQLEAT